MASFISAGHTQKGKNYDSGAVGVDGLREADLNVDFRNLVVSLVRAKGVKVITDDDTESLGEYLKRIRTGAGSVVLDFHFDASVKNTATGTTAIVGVDADRLDKAFAQELVNVTAATLGIRNRGVITEAQSARGRLGLMREQGTVALLEIGFITNPNDIAAYQANKLELASKIADLVKKYEDLV